MIFFYSVLMCMEKGSDFPFVMVPQKMFKKKWKEKKNNIYIPSQVMYIYSIVLLISLLQM